jgi:hypothetical protein
MKTAVFNAAIFISISAYIVLKLVQDAPYWSFIGYAMSK